MTEQEAIGKLNMLDEALNFQRHDADECSLALNMAINALEKQIPSELEKHGFFKVCKCGCEMSTFLMYNRANYCPNCGQAIKWE